MWRCQKKIVLYNFNLCCLKSFYIDLTEMFDFAHFDTIMLLVALSRLLLTIINAQQVIRVINNGKNIPLYFARNN